MIAAGPPGTPIMGAMSQSLSDLFRRLENLISLGTIAEVDHPSRRFRGEISGRKTGWLPYPADIGANYRRWRPLRVGTQAVFACPSGDPAQAVLVSLTYSDDLPPPATDGGLDLIQFDDGTAISYDSAAQALTVTTPGRLSVTTTGPVSVASSADVAVTATGSATISAGGTVTIAAPALALTATNGAADAATMQGSFRLSGDFSITGNITVDGNVSASGTIMDGGGNSPHHTH